MSTSNDLERKIFSYMYRRRSKNPTAYQKYRADHGNTPSEKVQDALQSLVERQLLRGNVAHRNFQLTPDGLEYIEDKFPEILAES